jgi:hypothetical protein
MRLYHGSNIQGLKVINPSKNNYDPEVKVYMSVDKRFAACFGTKWNYNYADLGSWDNYKTLIFGITNLVNLDQPCSLYEVECNNFIQLYPMEFISKEPVKVIEEIRYNSFKDMLLNNDVKIVTHKEYQSNIFNTNPEFHYLF